MSHSRSTRRCDAWSTLGTRRANKLQRNMRSTRALRLHACSTSGRVRGRGVLLHHARQTVRHPWAYSAARGCRSAQPPLSRRPRAGRRLPCVIAQRSHADSAMSATMRSLSPPERVTCHRTTARPRAQLERAPISHHAPHERSTDLIWLVVGAHDVGGVGRVREAEAVADLVDGDREELEEVLVR